LKEADSDGSSTRRLIVAGAPAESRLDAFLASQLPDLSRSRITQLIATGRILVNGEPARKSAKPVDGDVIEVSIPAPAPSHIAPEAIPLSVVFEDADLAVIDKPAGLVVHPAPGHRSGTLVNALLHHVQDLSGIGGVKRPGIVHRLDRDTSGLLLVAKNDDAHRALSAALKKREIRRTYLAAVWGHLTSDDMRIDAPI
jgi:23S rRNA pseudouridine1911/1915/1917 synthase